MDNQQTPPATAIPPTNPLNPQISLQQANQTFAHLAHRIKIINYAAKAAALKTYTREHPYRTALHLSSMILLVAPGLLAGPVLGSVGFGAQGVVRGSAAAAHHAEIGNVVARSFFAVLQSAGAGGYGVAVVNGVVQVGAALMGMGSVIGRWLRGRKETEGEGEGDGDGDGDGDGESGDEGMGAIKDGELVEMVLMAVDEEKEECLSPA
ncbi:MAG: hypothetical protein LQ343_004716 [Gyalolechia ehrenbergii]|nr:MAG: hypothetical protein LQ343_004716 [Gyalolechia ehrenbergii]